MALYVGDIVWNIGTWMVLPRFYLNFFLVIYAFNYCCLKSWLNGFSLSIEINVNCDVCEWLLYVVSWWHVLFLCVLAKGLLKWEWHKGWFKYFRCMYMEFHVLFSFLLGLNWFLAWRMLKLLFMHAGTNLIIVLM